MNASGTVTATNIFGANGLMARTAGSKTTLYTFDPQGNVAQRVDAQPDVASAPDMYNAKGDPYHSGVSPSDPWGFGGQWGGYTDAETGLVLMTHRYYDPNAGRFITRDPMSYAGGINLYAYTQNNPVNRTDPSGLQAVFGSCPVDMLGRIGGECGADGDGLGEVPLPSILLCLIPIL